MHDRRLGRGRPGAGTQAWLILALVLVLGAGIGVIQFDSRRGLHAPKYSVHRTDDQGAALIFRVYERMGVRAQAWDRRFDALSRPGLMLLIAPEQSVRLLNRADLKIGTVGDILPVEVAALDAWVARGNVVVLMSRDATSIHESLGILLDELGSQSPSPSIPAQPSALAVGVKELQTQSPFGFKFGVLEAKGTEQPKPVRSSVIPAQAWSVLFNKVQGARKMPQVVSAVRGAGLYVLANDAYPATNAGLLAGDNVQFMRNIARLVPPSGTLWLDEYHKRSAPSNVVAYLRERSMTGALVYVVLLVLIWVWHSGVRFGPERPLVRDERRDSIEYVRAIATLYRNAGMPRDVLETVFLDFKKRLLGALRLDGKADVEQIAQTYQRRTGRPGLEARRALIDTELALTRPRMSDTDAAAIAARLTAVDEALHGRSEMKQHVDGSKALTRRRREP